MEAFEQWWNSQGQYCKAGGGDYEKTFAYAAWNAALADRNSRTENAPPSEARGNTDKHAREEFLAKAKQKGYDGLVHYITVMSECYEVPLEVARSCFIVATYEGAFTEFVELLREYKRKKGETK